MKQTDWDRWYIRGTMRRPTDLNGLYPAAAPTAERPFSYALWKQLGRAIGLVGFMWLLSWLIPALLKAYK